jgi:peptidylprolyl isomerase
MQRIYRYVFTFLPLLALIPLGCGGGGEETASTNEKLNDVQVEVIKPGSGDEAKSGDKLEVHYIGWVQNSPVPFDSSFNLQQPFTVNLGKHQVIRGWEKGLEGMKVGERRRLTIPPELAYGERGFAPKIRPNSTLVFEVDLISINKPTESNAEATAASDRLPPEAKSAEKPAEVKVEVLEAGKGEGAKLGDRLSVHYTGWLTDGTKFDSSRDRGQPFSLTLGRREVIPGWEKGLEGMKVGERRKLTIPPHLGYGPRGYEPSIPPNATLVFDVEMVKIGK